MWSQSVWYTFNYNLILFPVGIVIKYLIKSSKYKYMLYYIKFLLRAFDKVMKIFNMIFLYRVFEAVIKIRIYVIQSIFFHRVFDVVITIWLCIIHSDILSSSIRYTCSHQDMDSYYST